MKIQGSQRKLRRIPSVTQHAHTPSVTQRISPKMRTCSLSQESPSAKKATSPCLFHNHFSRLVSSKEESRSPFLPE